MFSLSAYLVFHIILAQLMSMTKTSGTNFATIHALISLVVCSSMAFNKKRPEKTLYALAYIPASEVLWRMTKARVFWEFGKYAIVLIAIISIFSKGPKRVAVPFLYLLLLMPAIFILPFDTKDLEVLRQQISFNLSGPLALAACVVCCSGLKVTSDQLQKAFIVFLGPVAGVASIAGMSVYSAREMFKHETESSFAGSGGFGPNQVSGLLGMGAVIALFYLLENKNKKIVRGIMFFLGLLFATQSALTFSRGGLYCAAGALFFLILNMVQNKKSRNRIVSSLVLVLLAANFIALPALTKFTGGAIVERFKDTSATGRESIFQDDISIWLKNPILGVGPGESTFRREKYGRDIVAHSEISRLLSEHGIFGLISLILLVVMAASAYRRAKHPTSKALVTSMVVWTILNMLTAAMRIGLGSFVYGLAFIQYIPPQPLMRKRSTDEQQEPTRPQGIDVSK